MCGKKVLQDYAILDKHLRGNHNIDISEYKDVLVQADVLKQLGLSNPNGHAQEDTDDVESLPSANVDPESTPRKSQEDDQSNQVRLTHGMLCKFTLLSFYETLLKMVIPFEHFR